MPGQIIGANPKNATLPLSSKLGVKWYKNNSPTTLTRLYDAVGLNFTPAVGGTGGSSDFDGMPIYKDIRLCNMQSGVVIAYEGEPGFTRTPGTGIDVMVEIPKFYYKIEDTATERDFLISDQPLYGFAVSPRHAPHIGAASGHDKIYVSAYTLNSSYQSKSGNASLVSITRATARTGCTGRGTKYSQYDFATLMTLWLLYIVETANWDSQAAVGGGITSGSAQVNTGDSDGVSFHSGSVGAAGTTTRAVKYRNMENLWGNLYAWVDGFNMNDQTAYFNLNPATYADDTATNYTVINNIGLSASANGDIKGLTYDASNPWAMIPNVSNGAVGTYIPDYMYVGDSGWRVLFAGGGWGAGTSAGLFCFDASSPSSSTSTYIGCRLLVLP